MLDKVALKAHHVAFAMEYSVARTVAVARAGMDEDFQSGMVNNVICLLL